MEHCLSTLEELSGRWACPEPYLPPGLNQEQAWAWAMDNFPALSRRSCQGPQLYPDGNYGACGRLRQACSPHGGGSGVERGPKRCREPSVQEPKADTAMGPQSPPEEADATGRVTEWSLNQPGDASASGGGQTGGDIAWGRPDRLRKLLKIKA